jgi:hypothetical protein
MLNGDNTERSSTQRLRKVKYGGVYLRMVSLAMSILTSMALVALPISLRTLQSTLRLELLKY